MKGVRVVTPATGEPVSLAEAKLQLRVDGSDEDALIGNLIAAGRRTVELLSGRALAPQTLELTLDDWPENGIIWLPMPPLQSVASIVYVDDAGGEHTLAESAYLVGAACEPGRVAILETPVGDLAAIEGVRVQYDAGYADGETPQTLKQAILLLVGHWYENREAALSGTYSREIALGVERLVEIERVQVY